MNLDEAHLILNVKKDEPLEAIQRVRRSPSLQLDPHRVLLLTARELMHFQS